MSSENKVITLQYTHVGVCILCCLPSFHIFRLCLALRSQCIINHIPFSTADDLITVPISPALVKWIKLIMKGSSYSSISCSTSRRADGHSDYRTQINWLIKLSWLQFLIGRFDREAQEAQLILSVRAK